MRKSLKKIISLVLTVLLIASVVAPAALAADDAVELPVVVIGGRVDTIYSKENGTTTKVYPKLTDEVQYAKDCAKELVQPFVKAYALDTDEGWKEYCDLVYDMVAPIFDTIQLDENANPLNNTGTWFDYKTASIRKDTGSNYRVRYYANNDYHYDYQFYYDWRLDPMELAEQLDAYVDRVLQATGKSQVKMYVHCLGAVVFSAYIADDERAAKVEQVVYSVPSSEESQTISALFTGNLQMTSEAVDAYCTYYLNSEQNRFFEDDDFTSFAVALVSLLEQAKVLGLTMDQVQYVIDRCVDYLCPNLVRNSFFFPTYWAMIGDDYEEAKAYLFDTDELKAKYGINEDGSVREGSYIDKIDYYHYNVQVNLKERIKECNEKFGMKVSFITRYGCNLLPISENCMTLGDGRLEVSSLSYGATTADMNNTLTEKYGASYLEGKDMKYISADGKIDASTCVFPDSTWFVRNLYHAGIDYTYDLAYKNFAYDGQATVDTFDEYPQFLHNNGDGTLSEVTEDNEYELDNRWTTNIFQALIRFVTSLFNMFKKLIGKA